MFNFDVPINTYYTVGDPERIKSSVLLNDHNIKNIFNWLKELKLEQFTKNFIVKGYHSIELLFMQMGSR